MATGPQQSTGATPTPIAVTCPVDLTKMKGDDLLKKPDYFMRKLNETITWIVQRIGNPQQLSQTNVAGFQQQTVVITQQQNADPYIDVQLNPTEAFTTYSLVHVSSSGFAQLATNTNKNLTATHVVTSLTGLNSARAARRVGGLVNANVQVTTGSTTSDVYLYLSTGGTASNARPTTAGTVVQIVGLYKVPAITAGIYPVEFDLQYPSV